MKYFMESRNEFLVPALNLKIPDVFPYGSLYRDTIIVRGSSNRVFPAKKRLSILDSRVIRGHSRSKIGFFFEVGHVTYIWEGNFTDNPMARIWVHRAVVVRSRKED